MLLIDVTIVTTALPDMARSLDASFTALQWVVDIYAVALAALLMAAGSVADLYGRRRVFVWGLALFALSSLACGLAPGESALIAARAVQGIGAAAVFAANAPLITATYHGKDRGVAFGVWGAVIGAATGFGLALGGLLTEYVSWRAIFFVNLPLCAVALWITLRTVPESKAPAPASGRARIDWPGAALFTLAAGALTYGLVRGGDAGWTDPLALVSLTAAAVAAVAFVLAERNRPVPLLDLALLRRPSFAVLMGAALLVQAAAFAHFVYSSLWVQSVLGMSPLEAGTAMLPMAAASFLVSGLGGRYFLRMRPQLPLGVGVMVIGAGVLAMTLVGPGSSWTALLPGCVLTGCGVGLAMTVLVSAALGAAPPERAGMASGAVNTFRQLGYALGIAVLGTVFASRVKDSLGAHGVPEETADAVGSGRAMGSGVPMGQVREAFASGLDLIFVISGVTALLVGLVVLLVVRERAPGADHGPRPPPAPLPRGLRAPLRLREASWGPPPGMRAVPGTRAARGPRTAPGLSGPEWRRRGPGRRRPGVPVRPGPPAGPGPRPRWRTGGAG
ncbi:MFS transporter [Streptomyces albiaxialis]|uniref:MFS transporter n=1 Tax=Streptomyces albiaxialis TaxID=329523 RepID=A0ABN2VJV0_9ACTN